MFLWIENVINEMELGNGHIEANSHNEGDYLSLIHALRVCLENGIQNVVVKGNSLLIINGV